MPKQIVDKINHDVIVLLDSAAVKDSLSRQAAEPLKRTPEQLGEMLRDDIKKWAVAVEKSGARVD